MNEIRTSPTSRKTAVVIPYYQEEPGILRGAVMSAIAQEGVSDLEIIVVDDGSPAPARDDLRDLNIPAHITLKLIEQPNRGPGAARNRALEHVSTDTTYIAFLDSDDRWTKAHLHNAHSILGEGYDMYFSDYWFSDLRTTFFSRRGTALDEHVRLSGNKRFYLYCGNAKLEIIGGRNLFTTSTVVYRYSNFANLRFPVGFMVGEDLTFALHFVARSSQIVFSSDIECVSDRGVHIFENSVWNTPKGIWMLHEAMRWRKWLPKRIEMDCVESEQNMLQIRNLRRGFIISLLHQFLRLRGFKNINIVRFVKSDPAVLLDVFPVVFNVLLNKAGVRKSQNL